MRFDAYVVEDDSPPPGETKPARRAQPRVPELPAAVARHPCRDRVGLKSEIGPEDGGTVRAKASFMDSMTPAAPLRIRVLVMMAFAACLQACGSDGNVVVDRNQLVWYAANWDGYVEAFTFRSGTDRVRVVLSPTGDGWLQVGDGDPVPPPSDPNIGYPPVVRENPLPAFGTSLFDAVAYSITGARVEAERLRFDFDFMSVYGKWCELQTLVQRFNVDEYGCTAEASIGSANADGSCTTHESAGG
ncbi:MAG: hypothetical protein ABJA82_08835 [Myxococcales bacterium]